MLRAALLPVLLLCLLLPAPEVVQAQGRDVAGASDHPSIDRFPGARITEYASEDVASHTLVLGRMQRVNGRVTPGDSQRLRGHLTRITYEIPSGYPGEEAYDFFRAQLLQGDQPALFSCQGRGCGSSNFWANEVFGNRILYGPEANQFYLATRLDAEGERFVSLYVITRGNRRVYAHIEILEPTFDAGIEVEVTPQALLRKLNMNGSVALPGLAFDADDTLSNRQGLSQVVSTLRLNTLLEVYIVAHLQGPGSLEELLRRSTSRAEALRSALIEAGIDADRLGAAGVGPLSPVCAETDCAERVELVLQNP